MYEEQPTVASANQNDKIMHICSASGFSSSLSHYHTEADSKFISSRPHIHTHTHAETHTHRRRHHPAASPCPAVWKLSNWVAGAASLIRQHPATSTHLHTNKQTPIWTHPRTICIFAFFYFNENTFLTLQPNLMVTSLQHLWAVKPEVFICFAQSSFNQIEK